MSVLLNANELCLSMPTWRALPSTHHSQEDNASYASGSMYNIMVDVYMFIAMARGDAFIQPYQFDPESEPEGEAPEEVQTLQLQQDISEWLVCLNNVSLFVCVVTVTTM